MMRRVSLACWIGLLGGLGAAPLALGASEARTDERGWVAHQLELEGPLHTVRLVGPDGGETHLRCALEAGERRTWMIPMSARWPSDGSVSELGPGDVPSSAQPTTDASGAQFPIEVEALGGGAVLSIRAEEAPGELGVPASTPWAAPFVGERLPLVPTSVLGLGIAWAMLLVATRRRPWIALAVTMALGASLGFWFPTGGQSGGPSLRLIDRSPSGSVMVVEAARDRLSVDLGRLDSVRFHGGAAPSWFGQVGPGGRPHWSWQSTGAYLRARYTADLGARTLDPAFNGLGSIRNLWVQTDAGLWEARGPWTLGEPLPSVAAEEAEQPPSWLLTDLPLAGSIWLGRLEPGGFAGDIETEPTDGGHRSEQGSAAREVWVRWAD